jgi:hypothetical protein
MTLTFLVKLPCSFHGSKNGSVKRYCRGKQKLKIDSVTGLWRVSKRLKRTVLMMGVEADIMLRDLH